MKVTYVLVTYNRLNLLKETINAAVGMTEKFDKIIIIDNHSTDGTSEFLDELKENYSEIEVIHTEKNLGGSGGFSLGVKIATEKTPENWVFLADDDAIPQKDMLKNLKDEYEKIQNKDEIAALCTSVLNLGKIDTAHRARVHQGLLFIKHKEVLAEEYDKTFFVDVATFVGLMVKPEVVKNIGVPRADFFIYYDDTDYCMKIKKYGKILCIPSSKMDHNTKLRQAASLDWRDYYATRNVLIYMKSHYKKKYYKFYSFYLKLRRCSLPSRILKKRKKKDVKVLLDAIYDAKLDKMGIHKIYHP